MDIAAYLKKHGLTQKQFADKIGCTQGAVSQWLLGAQPSAERAVEIEKKTDGQIQRHELRPDLFAKQAA